MNISKNTIEILNEMFTFTFYDNYINEVEPSEATEIHIGYSKDFQYIGKSVKATKKETTIEYILDKINADKTFKNFSEYFNKLVSNFGLSAYATSYGIGIFVAIGRRDKISESKNKVEKLLTDMGIKFSTEKSEAGWVFRYKISRSSENIKLINSL